MNNITHYEVIRYLRTLGREMSRNAEQMTDNAHPMADFFEARASEGNNVIEKVCDLLISRENEQRAEFEASLPAGPDHSDREVFNTP